MRPGLVVIPLFNERLHCGARLTWYPVACADVIPLFNERLHCGAKRKRLKGK